MTECADDTDGLALSNGQYVTSSSCKWDVLGEIGKGGYGSVYKVKLSNAPEEYALKVEKKNIKRLHYKLQMEIAVLKEVAANVKEDHRSHFVDIRDKAKKENFCFVVMTLLGESLADLRKQRSPAVFTLSTAYRGGIDSLEAVEELHMIGYIHRDIKPGNYAVGKGARRGWIYILDFGIARKIYKENKEIKAPRAKVAFKGTVRYAPIACHKQQDLGRKDDVESWLYMIVDMANVDGCNWRGEKSKEKVLLSKENARSAEGRARFFRGMDIEQFSLILEHIDSLTYCDEPDYDYIKRLIKRAGRRAKLNLEDPYDWESTPEREPKVDRKPPQRGSKESAVESVNPRRHLQSTVTELGGGNTPKTPQPLF